jgi:lysophospholipase L1-like esterase
MRPKQVFILVGTNDLERGGTPETIAKNIREICVTCQRECSDIEIYVLSIYPVNESSLFSDMVGKRTNKDICTANRLIAHTLSNVDSAHYVDLYASLLEDGQLNQRYTYDGLHLSIQGYRWVTDRLKTLVRHG